MDHVTNKIIAKKYVYKSIAVMHNSTWLNIMIVTLACKHKLLK